MQEYKEVELTTGEVLNVKILVKTITAMIVRNTEGKYLMISRDVIKNEEQFKFRN